MRTGSSEKVHEFKVPDEEELLELWDALSPKNQEPSIRKRWKKIVQEVKLWVSHV